MIWAERQGRELVRLGDHGHSPAPRLHSPIDLTRMRLCAHLVADDEQRTQSCGIGARRRCHFRCFLKHPAMV